MLSFAFRAPEGSERGPVVLYLVVERENMVRMTAGDPFDIQLQAMARTDQKTARVLNYRRATDLDIVVAYEEPEGIRRIHELISKNDMVGVLTYLERGRTIHEGEPSDPKKLVI